MWFAIGGPNPGTVFSLSWRYLFLSKKNKVNWHHCITSVWVGLSGIGETEISSL